MRVRSGDGKFAVAAISVANSGDGLAYAARLLWTACTRAVEDGLRLIELGAERAERVPLQKRVSFAAAILAGQLSGSISGILYTHVGIARAQGLVPGWTRRPYGVMLNGIEAWDPDLTPDRYRALRGAAVRIAISHHTARRVHSVHPNIGPIAACPLALLPDEPSGAERVNEAVLARIQPRSMLIVGRMSAAERYKGHDQLLEVWPSVLQRVADAQLVVVGGGDDVDRLRGKAADLGVGSSVYFTGFLDNATLRAVRGRVATFGMPSSGEGFGLVYLEAMRAGLPCLGSADDAAADIIRDGETGFLVSPGDPRGMSDAIVALLENEPLRRTYGAAGQRRFEAEFTLERFIDRFQPLLEPLMSAKRPMAR